MQGLVVRPLGPGERERFDAELAAHHWLGCRLFGEAMRYVATGEDGTWLALVGFGSAAFVCGPRDAFVGWSDEQRGSNRSHRLRSGTDHRSAGGRRR
jgi:hypothetical protein